MVGSDDEGGGEAFGRSRGAIEDEWVMRGEYDVGDSKLRYVSIVALFLQWMSLRREEGYRPRVAVK